MNPPCTNIKILEKGANFGQKSQNCKLWAFKKESRIITKKKNVHKSSKYGQKPSYPFKVQPDSEGGMAQSCGRPWTRC
ncbi:unnamed protein product [Acanthoscelides obtectus]|uniref:Uncharacterized protein n=1 Tax=Acanthoscelides obtectus TaxID=200917 RepID=A0A9P0P5W8_ACAOB|nr:unnamed protein product [Acanthoscelides obtectus]CAK1631160.1 hypothetical protein AOBTE_LOCUS6789 [Acanthoscelides obtectus]